MIINHNLNAMNSHRQMTGNVANAGKSMEKLSSGLRINRAGDDAAGLAISEKMRGQIRGLDQASRNSQDSISMIQTAEGALNETHSILQRMRELAVQAGNDTNTSTDRGEIQKEMNQLTSEINRIGNTTEFNNQKLLNAQGGTVTGATTTPATAATVSGGAASLGVKTNYTSNNLKFDVVVGSTTKTVTLNANYDGSTKTMNDVATDLGNAIGSGVTVSATGGKLTIKAANTTDSIEIKAATSGDIADIGLTAGVSAPTATSTTPAKSSFTSQVGANENQTMTLEFNDMRAAALGITGTGNGYTGTNGVTNGTNNTPAENGLDVSDSAKAGNAVTKIQDAINTVSAERSKLGAYQNRLEHTINNLGTSSENLSAAESRIRDVDMAKEMMNFSKNNILSQASQAMLAQAKSQPEAVLQLLR